MSYSQKERPMSNDNLPDQVAEMRMTYIGTEFTILSYFIAFT